MATQAETMAKFSVQGVLFPVKMEMIMAHDWLLRKVITSEVPWEQAADGQIFLDIDLKSFRFIISILSNVSNLRDDVQKLSCIDLTLIQSTARYLMLESIYEEVGGIKAGFEKELQERDEKYQLRNTEMKALEEEATGLHAILTSLNQVDVRMVRCGARSKRGSDTTCNCQSIIIGPLTLKGGAVQCDKCDNIPPRGHQFKESYCDWSMPFESYLKGVVTTFTKR